MSPEDRTLDPEGDLFLILTDHVETGKSDSMDDVNNTTEREICVQCSSKHLMLASSVFKAMLSQNFMESSVLRSVGTLRLPLPDDNPDALLILLYIIHGQTKETPFAVDLFVLTQIAILVDKYRLYMAVGILSRIWIGNLSVETSKSSTEDMRRWILISWVFQYPNEFTVATRIAVRQCGSRIDECGDIDLPIPSSIVDTIDQHRQKALSEIITTLHGVLEKYQGPNLTCSSRCDAIVLGSLTRTMKSLQILTPPEPPFRNLSFESLAKGVLDMDIMTDCQGGLRRVAPTGPCSNITYYGFNSPINKDIVKSEIELLITKVEGRLGGLNLTSWTVEDST